MSCIDDLNLGILGNRSIAVLRKLFWYLARVSLDYCQRKSEIFLLKEKRNRVESLLTSISLVLSRFIHPTR